MRAGVADAVFRIAVRQIITGLTRVKCEFEHLHAGEAGFLDQLLHLGRQEAKVLRDEIGIRAVFADRADELHAGALDPLALAGGVVDGRDGPIALDAAEMVDADNVEVLSRRAQTAHPPGEAILLHALPVVDGVAPVLAVGVEPIGRAARPADGACGSAGSSRGATRRRRSPAGRRWGYRR